MESTLKIINERCEELVRELFVDCERVECFRGADQRVRLAAAFGRRLSVAEVYNGLKVQVRGFVFWKCCFHFVFFFLYLE